MPDRPPEPDRPAARDPLPERPSSATVGLLEYITAHSVDEDYAYVAAQRAETAEATAGGSPRRVGLLGALAVGLFALLVVTAAVQTSRDAVGDAADRSSLAGQVRSATDALRADQRRVATLRQETAQLQAQQLAGDRTSRGVAQQLQRLSLMTGASAVRGPGVRVVADDAPGAEGTRNEVLDTDLQRLVNGLWGAGAEAISVDGQRLTNLSTIRTAGGAITVNARSLRPPYVVLAVGDQDTLPARFAETSSGQAWLALQRDVGLRLTITPEDVVRLPAAPVSVRFAKIPTAEGAR